MSDEDDFVPIDAHDISYNINFKDKQPARESDVVFYTFNDLNIKTSDILVATVSGEFGFYGRKTFDLIIRWKINGDFPRKKGFFSSMGEFLIGGMDERIRRRMKFFEEILSFVFV